MSHEEYNNIVALNYSGAKMLLRSPLHYKASLTEEKKDSPALLMGRLVHLMALQPEVYADRVVISPTVDRRTKDGKAVWEAFQALVKEGQECVSADVQDEVTRIANAARNALEDLKLTDWQTEKSIVVNLKSCVSIMTLEASMPRKADATPTVLLRNPPVRRRFVNGCPSSASSSNMCRLANLPSACDRRSCISLADMQSNQHLS